MGIIDEDGLGDLAEAIRIVARDNPRQADEVARLRSAMTEHEIKITVSPKLLGYIDALIESEHGYGSTRDEVALYLIWQEVNRLRESGRELARAAGRQEGP